MNKKLNGFNNGKDTTDGAGGKPGVDGKEFTITFNEDSYKEDVITMKENKTLENIVFEALGAASTCWLPNTGDLVFDSSKATEIGNKLIEDIKSFTPINIDILTLEENQRDLLIKIISDFYKDIKEEPPLEQIVNFVNYSVAHNNYKPSLQEAVEVLCNALREDKSEGSYYDSLVRKLAEAFYKSGLEFYDFETPIENYLVTSKTARDFIDNLIKQ